MNWLIYFEARFETHETINSFTAHCLHNIPSDTGKKESRGSYLRQFLIVDNSGVYSLKRKYLKQSIVHWSKLLHPESIVQIIDLNEEGNWISNSQKLALSWNYHPPSVCNPSTYLPNTLSWCVYGPFTSPPLKVLPPAKVKFLKHSPLELHFGLRNVMHDTKYT